MVPKARIITLLVILALSTLSVLPAAAAASPADQLTELEIFSISKDFATEVLGIRPTKIIIQHGEASPEVLKFKVYGYIDNKRVVASIEYSNVRRCITIVKFVNDTGIPVKSLTDVKLFLRKYMLFYEQRGIRDNDLRTLVTTFIRTNVEVPSEYGVEKSYRVGEVNIKIVAYSNDYYIVTLEKVYKVGSSEIPAKYLSVVVKHGTISILRDYVTSIKVCTSMKIPESKVKTAALRVLIPLLIKYRIPLKDLRYEISITSKLCKDSDTAHIKYNVKVYDAHGKFIATVEIDSVTGDVALVDLKVSSDGGDYNVLSAVIPLTCIAIPLALSSLVTNMCKRKEKEAVSHTF